MENDIIFSNDGEGNNLVPTEKGDDDLSTRIKALKDALSDVEDQIHRRKVDNAKTICVIVLCSIILFTIAFLYACYLLKSQDYKTEWTWQMIYFTFSRAIIFASIYYLATICFNLLRSYLHIQQRTTHRLIVIKSMASLVEAATSSVREKIYQQLLDIIINYDETGLLKEDSGIKLDNKDLKDFLLKLLDKAPSIK